MNATNIDLGVFVRLHDKLLKPLRKSEGEVAASSKRMNKNLKLSLKLAGAGAVAAGIAAASKRMVDAALEPVRAVEKARGELASLGVENTKVITDMGKQLERQYAGLTTDAFTRAAYDIRSGISTLTDEGVADMTRAAVIVAKATKGVPEEMTSLFATGYGIFKEQYAAMSDADFGLLFGDMISASVQQFKTDGAQMQAAIESAGASATKYGMAMSDQFAVLGQLQATMSGSEAGTALRAFAQKAAEADDAFAKLAASSGNPVRVRIVDENGMMRAMPDMLTDLKARYGDTLDAIEGAEIKQAFGSDEAVKIITTLYGQEAAVRANAKALEDAAQSGGKFTQSMAGALDNNFDSRMIKMEQRWNVMKLTIGEKMIPIIEKIAPVLERAMDGLMNFANAHPEVAGGIALVVLGVGTLAAILTPLLFSLAMLAGSSRMAGTNMRLLRRSLRRAGGASGVFRKSLASSKAGLTSFGSKTMSASRKIFTLGKRYTVMAAKFTTGAIKSAGLALMGLGKRALATSKRLLLAGVSYVTMAAKFTAGKIVGAVTMLGNLGRAALLAGGSFVKAGLMMMLSPIGLVVALVAAIAGAAYLIYANWDTVGPYFVAIWEGIKAAFFGAVELVKSYILNFTPMGLIYTHWDGIAAWFGDLWEGVKAAFSKVFGWAVSAALNFTAAGLIYKHWDSIAAWFSTLWGGVKSAFSASWTGIKNMVSGWAVSMRNIGVNIVQGLANGILSAPSAVWNALKGVVMGGVSRVKGWLGIKSPSRVFMGIGGNVTDGLARGIGDGEQTVMQRMTGMARQMVKPFARPFNGPSIAPKISLQPVAKTLGGAVAGLAAPLALSTANAAMVPPSGAVQEAITAPAPAIAPPASISVPAPVIQSPDAITVPSPAIVPPAPLLMPAPRFSAPAPLSVPVPGFTVDSDVLAADGDSGTPGPPPGFPPAPPPPPSAGAVFAQTSFGNAGQPASAGAGATFAPVYNIDITLNGEATADDEQRMRELFEELSREHADQLAADVRRNMHD